MYLLFSVQMQSFACIVCVCVCVCVSVCERERERERERGRVTSQRIRNHHVFVNTYEHHHCLSRDCSPIGLELMLKQRRLLNVFHF